MADDNCKSKELCGITMGMMDEDEKEYSGAFLIGCHRSGTTLLRFILDSHPNVSCPPETKFISAFAEAFRYPQARQGLAGIGVSSRELLDCFADFSGAAMRRHAAASGKRRWVDKTPNYFRHIDFIDAMFSQSARYILIVRHPIDTAMSLASRFPVGCATDDPDLSPIVSSGSGLLSWTKYWLNVYTTLRHSTHHMNDRVLWCKYEDLVSHPKKETERAFHFLGETMPDELLASAFATPHARGYEDPLIRSTQSVHRTSVGKYRSLSQESLADAWQAVAEVAQYWNYAITDDDPDSLAAEDALRQAFSEDRPRLTSVNQRSR